jgi:Flp pilus assembly protein TadD
MSNKQDDLMSFLSDLPGVEFVNVSKDGVKKMDGAQFTQQEKLRKRHEEGVSLFQKGNCVEALKCFKEVIDQGFNDSKAYLNMGVCYATMGNWPEALKWLRLAHSKFPNDDQITQNLAVAEQSARAGKKWYQFWK